MVAIDRFVIRREMVLQSGLSQLRHTENTELLFTVLTHARTKCQTHCFVNSPSSFTIGVIMIIMIKLFVLTIKIDLLPLCYHNIRQKIGSIKYNIVQYVSLASVHNETRRDHCTRLCMCACTVQLKMKAFEVLSQIILWFSEWYFE